MIQCEDGFFYKYNLSSQEFSSKVAIREEDKWDENGVVTVKDESFWVDGEWCCSSADIKHLARGHTLVAVSGCDGWVRVYRANDCSWGVYYPGVLSLSVAHDAVLVRRENELVYLTANGVLWSVDVQCSVCCFVWEHVFYAEQGRVGVVRQGQRVGVFGSGVQWVGGGLGGLVVQQTDGYVQVYSLQEVMGIIQGIGLEKKAKSISRVVQVNKPLLEFQLRGNTIRSVWKSRHRRWRLYLRSREPHQRLLQQ